MYKMTGLAVFFLLLASNAQELVMVWAKKVDLYNNQGKIERILQNGQLVSAENFPGDNTRYIIQINGKKYNAKKIFFKTPAEIAVTYKKKILEYEAEIKKNDMRISNINSDLVIRYVQALELRRDTALAYQKISPVVTNNGPGYYRGFSIMLSVAKYKRLMKEWGKDVQAILDEKAKLQELKRKYSIAIEGLKHQLASFENLGDMAVKEKVAGDTYLILQDGAELYINNKVMKRLKRGESVLGRPHPKFSGWHEVISEDKKYTVSSKALVKKSEYSKVLGEKIIASKILVEQLTSEVELQQFRLKLYQGVSRQLEANKFVQGGYGLVKNLIVPIDKERSFTIKSPNADEVFVNSVIADKVLREWKAEALELQKASLQNQKNILNLKKNLIDLENAQKEFNK